MASKCSVCNSRSIDKVDEAIIAGEPHRAIGAKYGLAKSAIGRHARHAPPVAQAAAKLQEIRAEAAARSSLTVLEKIRTLTEAGAPPALARAEAGELDHLKALELEAKLSGELVKKVDVAVIAGRQLSPVDTLAAMDRMRAELAAQVEEEKG